MKMVNGILLTIAIIFGIVIVCLIVIAVSYSKINTNEQPNKEETLLSDAGDKKALILYQDSKGKLVGDNVQLIASALRSEGFDVTMNHPRLDNTYSALDYEVVVLVSPVYMGHISQPLCDYADRQDFSNSKVFILVTGHIENSNEADEVKTHVKNAKAVNGIKVGKPRKRPFSC